MSKDNLIVPIVEGDVGGAGESEAWDKATKAPGRQMIAPK